MKVIIFGDGAFASLVCYCLQNDSQHQPVGFTVNRSYKQKEIHDDLPVFAFEDIERDVSPAETAVVVAIGPHERNWARPRLMAEAKSRGFARITYVSSRALTWPDLSIGENSFVFEGAVIQPFARIGANCIIRSSVHVSHHVVIEDNCFISAGVCFGGGARVASRAFIGLGATIRDNIEIAEGAIIGAGAVVTGPTEPDCTYVGIPARKVVPSRSSEPS